MQKFEYGTFQRVLKGGSLRNSLRTTPRKRPTILKASDDVATDTDAGSVKLTSLKSNSDIKPSTKKAIGNCIYK